MLSIARTASFAGSAALLLTTSPMDFPGNRRDKMEMTSSLVGSSKSPIIRSSLALWIFYKQPPLCVNWTISLTGIYIYLKKKWFKERNKKFQKNSMEHYKNLVPVNILLELLLSINLTKLMDNSYLHHVPTSWSCNIILTNFGVVLYSLCKFGICLLKIKSTNKCDQCSSLY